MITGIDPGFTGGITRMMNGGTFPEYFHIPLKHHRFKYWTDKNGERRKTSVQGYDLIEIKRIIKDSDMIMIESQQAHPDQGIASTAKLMLGYGQLMGLCVGVGAELRTVVPRVWKKFFGLSSDKKEAIKLAIKLSGVDFIPEGKRVPQEGLAESYLIGLYGVKTNGKT